MNTRRKVVIGTSAVVLAAAASVGGWQLANTLDTRPPCMNAGATVVTHDAGSWDCVGVTDGSYRFDPGYQPLNDVEGKIKAEDRRVRASGNGKYVSVAYLLPISTNEGGTVVPIESVTEELAGAYAAQLFANTHAVEAGQEPQIQLLIASNGTQGPSDQDGYQAVDRDIENDKTSQHLVAVAGVAVSEQSTINEVEALAKGGIPVFGSDISSDDLDSVANVVRVSPGNSAAANAILNYFKGKYSSAFLISDRNKNDRYVATLVSDFPHFSGVGKSIVQGQEYDSSSGQGISQSRVGQMASAVCASSAQIVLFAGRAQELGSLLSAFGSQAQCTSQGKNIKIVTGGDVTNLVLSPAVKDGLKYVDLYYAGEAIPSEWRNKACQQQASTVNPQVPGQRGYQNFQGTFQPAFGEEFSDQDGVAMTGYDGMMTAVSAVRLAYGNKVPLTPPGVASELSALQRGDSVVGASGPVSFANYGNPKNGSNPFQKVFPILQLGPNGPAFVQCVQTAP